eukprot:14065117-Alexandrium_andersonii.AAC.1
MPGSSRVSQRPALSSREQQGVAGLRGELQGVARNTTLRWNFELRCAYFWPQPLALLKFTPS